VHSKQSRFLYATIAVAQANIAQPYLLFNRYYYLLPGTFLTAYSSVSLGSLNYGLRWQKLDCLWNQISEIQGFKDPARRTKNMLEYSLVDQSRLESSLLYMDRHSEYYNKNTYNFTWFLMYTIYAVYKKAHSLEICQSNLRFAV